ncbi:U3 small nucleolar RNA-associated protein [Taphrina deformans PYCC 5710]|uniref:U3 small nucleolar RNA-associated protein n=1 Tax=Taphrina deformans (strain PYCC 5710 / ATCC 11124 / CBS 356.35 / IMI 108563 / JCM 9778 / NBRC 8474) TaxID=1097556 RepID=R4X8E9_TAPDE|nr:U3 small nucleolar RNA-associated protein [Taphrina deformans PYCC 5710]|eukprot:CCG81869.1 U3 small nucleolar RNA-associated protein [Taphrina deformans PYCC 5710]
MNVHRTRFVDYTPPAITAIAFSHRSNPGDHHSQNLRCAVGRGNGDIEIWNPLDNWTLDITLKGGQGRSIEGLTWVTQKGHSPRLFSIGSSTLVTEWSLDLLQPRASLDCNAGAIWSIAVAPDQESIAMGCEDGTLVFADVSGGPGSLEYKYVLTRQKSRILSLAFSGPDFIVGGCSDSTVKVWDCRQARGPIVARMAVDRVRNEPTLVWSVIVLRNGTIVSGDSTGSVKLWDKKFYSLLQNFKLHQADVLCLGMNYAGDTLFSAGIDRKMQMYQMVDNKRRWAHISGRRFHAHDVRAMASYESRGMSSIVTGGVDMSLAIIPLQQGSKLNHRMISAVPQASHCRIARAARLLMMWSDRQIKIWQLCEPYEIDVEPHQQLVSKMTLQNEENLTCASISQDGTYLVVSSLVETKLYMLLPSESSSALRPIKIIDDAMAAQGARALSFSKDGTILSLVTPESDVIIYDVSKSDVDEEDGMFDVNFKQRVYIEMHATTDDTRKNQTYLKSVSHIDISPGVKSLAVSNQSGTTRIFDLGSGTLTTTLPTVSSSITALAFHGDDRVVITTANMQIHEFDVKSAKLSAWSSRNSSLVPTRFSRLHDHCTEMEVDAKDRLWMYGANWVSYLDLSKDLPINHTQSKRKRDGSAVNTITNEAELEAESEDLENDDDNNNNNNNMPSDLTKSMTKGEALRGKFWITFKYRSLLLFDVMNESELVVVERPAMDMINSGDIPPPFFVKRYGQN